MNRGVGDREAHKQSLGSLRELMEGQGVDYAQVWHKIKLAVLRSILTVLPMLQQHYKSAVGDDYGVSRCFHILGFDFIFKKSGVPVLLEVNQTPSYNQDSPLDKFVKGQVVKDCLKIVNITKAQKRKLLEFTKEDVEKRILDKNIRMTREEKQILKNLNIEHMDRVAQKNLGDYEEIRVEMEEQWQAIYDRALGNYLESTGQLKKKQGQPRASRNKARQAAPEQKPPPHPGLFKSPNQI